MTEISMTNRRAGDRRYSRRVQLLFSRLGREVSESATLRHQENVRSWAGTDSCEPYPRLADARDEVREELEVLIRGLGQWACPVEDPFAVLDLPERRRWRRPSDWERDLRDWWDDSR